MRKREREGTKRREGERRTRKERKREGGESGGGAFVAFIKAIISREYLELQTGNWVRKWSCA